MSTITIDASDVATAANFLEQFLTAQVTDGDFGKGTALRDLAVQAIAAVVAFLRADAAQIRQMQSLLTVKAAVGTGDVDALRDAVTGILSNFLVTSKGGGKARGFAIGHATQQVDVFVATSVRFTFTQGVVFVVDSIDTLFIPKEELVPIVDSSGDVLDYEFRIPLVAIATGGTYNIEPGLFTAFDRFNPYVTRVEATAKFTGGKGPETVDEILARAPTAVSVRNLVNDRSIEATLEDNFDGIEAILVIGMGEPEMQRDIVPAIAPTLKFHVGGAVDIYLRMGLVETSFVGSVGDLYARPDGVAVMFRDPSIDFIATGVETGDIIHVTVGLPSLPAEFLVEEIIDLHTLVVNERAPFPIATDEASPPTTVSYTIGRVGPSYSDVVSSGGLPVATGITSRRASTTGRITLPGGPVMDILDVAIINPAPGEATFKSTLDGFVHFPNQVNQTPSQAQTPAQGLQFQVVTHNPLYVQSALQWTEIVVGTDGLPARFDGYNLRVRYRTLDAFDTIDSFVRGERERIAAAFHLPRGHHPVVVSMDLKYTIKGTATTLPDSAAVAQTIIDYVNAFDATASSIDVSTVIQLVKNTYPDIANIVPPTPGAPILTITYDLRAPTGDVLGYSTTDVVSIDTAKQTAGPALVLIDLGVSDRTLRYVANAATITAELAP
jgi:hypothetical protein